MSSQFPSEQENPSGCEQTRCRQIFTGYCCELCHWPALLLFQEIKWKIIIYLNCCSGFPMLWAPHQLDRRILRSVIAQGSLSVNFWIVSGFISYHQSIMQLVHIIHQRYILVLQYVWAHALQWEAVDALELLFACGKELSQVSSVGIPCLHRAWVVP